MTRIATQNTFDVALLGIYSAQSRQAAAEVQISSGNIASDLKGYAGLTDALIATQTVKTRLDAYAATGAQLSDKLTGQDAALTAYSTAASGAGKVVLGAIATGDGSTLSASLQSYFSSAAGALNTNYQGSYLFSGGSDKAPVAVTNLSGLGAPATVASAFQNEANPTVSRLDDNTTLQTGALADQIGTPLFAALKSIADYVSANGAFSTHLTSTQSAFLEGTVASFSDASASATASVVANGLVQKQASEVQSQVTAQQTAATASVAKITSANVAQAYSDLTLSQQAIQASAQVFSTLKSSSLLNFLTSSGG